MIKLPIGVDINNLIDDLRIFSWEAGEILLFYSKLIKDLNYKNEIITSKDNEDPVTLADLKVNELIIQRINEKYKDINWEILSEENVKIYSENCNTNAEWRWVLDPLDGTKDFIQGTENYALHLALNYKQKPYLGVVLIPEKKELCLLKLISLLEIRNLFIIFLVCRVSSQAIKEAFLRIFIALGEISFKFPIGVPTIYKVLLSGS